jgi:hypothetical protein
VELLFDEEPLLHAPTVLSTVADENGEIRDAATYHVDDGDLGTLFTLHAVGATSGRTATTRFSDGAKLVIESAVAAPAVVSAGSPVTISVSVRNQGQGNPRDPRPAFNNVTVGLEVPAGWSAPVPQLVPVITTDAVATVTFTLVARPITTGSLKANASAASAGSFSCSDPGISCVAPNKPVTLTVLVDTTPPLIATPVPIVAEAAGPAGAAVSYVVSALDDVDGPVTASCSPASGSTFPLGTTTVSCSASDTAGNVAQASFTVTVQDTTAPLLSLSPDLVVEATGPAGAAVAFVATATDLVDGMLTPACTPAPGSTFPLGTTTVGCTATDAAGNAAQASFTVTVQDTTPPVLSLPFELLAADATAVTGAVVSWDPIVAKDVVDGDVVAACSPAPSTRFAPGTTIVSCTATDSHGNASAAKTFPVRVTFKWSDYLPPIHVDGSSAWKLGRTVPVKFQLTGASSGITDLVATISAARIADVAIGVTSETVFASSPDSGVTFRYDASADQYVYNLRTGAGAMVDATGTWVIRADLGDGVAHHVFVSLVR